MKDFLLTPEQLRLAFESARTSVWNWDLLSDQVTVDPLSPPLADGPAARRTRGREEWLSAIHPDDRAPITAAIKRSLENGANFGSAFRTQDPAGGWRWVGVRAGVRRDASGKPVAMAGVSVDITEQKTASAELARREEAVSSLINAIDGIVWEANPETFQFRFVSRHAERILGYPATDWLAQPDFWVTHLHPEDAQWCIEFCMNAVREERDYNFEYRMIAHDGRVVWLHDFVTVRRESAPGSARDFARDSGDTVLLRGVMVDITARKQAEEARRESEALFEVLFEQSPAGLVIFAADASKIRVNPAYCRFVGRSEQDVMATSIEEKLLPEDRPHMRQIVAVLDQGRSVDVELRFLRPDGEVVWGRLMARRTSSSGRLRPGLSIVEDITAQKRAEALLKASHENFRTVALDTPALLWLTSPQGHVTFFNRAVAEFMGVEIEALPFSSFTRIHPEDLVRSRALWDQAVRDRTSLVNESRLLRADGEYRWLVHRYEPRFSQTGEFLGHVGVATDITDRKLAQQKLQTAHDLLGAELQARARLQQELSDLSARLINAQEEERRRVARELHDSLGNQVAAFMLSLSSLGLRIGSAETGVLAKLLADMTQTIRDLSHQLHPVMLEFAGLAAATREMCSEYTALTGIKVNVVESQELGPIPPDVALCAYRVTQEALQNVARHSGAKHATVSLARDDGHLLLTIADHGVGYDAGAVRQHSGLGLVSIRERVRLLDGSLQVESAPGRGTTLRVSVPCPSDS